VKRANDEVRPVLRDERTGADHSVSKARRAVEPPLPGAHGQQRGQPRLPARVHARHITALTLITVVNLQAKPPSQERRHSALARPGAAADPPDTDQALTQFIKGEVRGHNSRMTSSGGK
jgi:hypothetical protein